MPAVPVITVPRSSGLLALTEMDGTSLTVPLRMTSCSVAPVLVSLIMLLMLPGKAGAAMRTSMTDAPDGVPAATEGGLA